jgi:hypothetical protein
MIGVELFNCGVHVISQFEPQREAANRPALRVIATMRLGVEGSGRELDNSADGRLRS